MFKKITIFFTAAISLLSFQTALAANPLQRAQQNLDSAMTANGGTGLEKDLGTSIGTVIKGLLSLVGTIFLVLTVWSGLTWMTAQGNEEKVAKSKSILVSATIGLFVVMSAYAITYFVTSKVGTSASGSNAEVCAARNNSRCVEVASDCMGTVEQLGEGCPYCCY